MSPNLSKHTLEEDKLIWNKGIIGGKFLSAKIIPLNGYDVCGESE